MNEEKTEENPTEKKDETQTKKENNILKGFLIAMISFAVLFVIISLVINSFNHFNYKGVKFEIDKETLAGKTVYRTSIPIPAEYTNELTGNAVSGDYNFWFRNDPRKLEDIILNGEIKIKKLMAINITKNFNCDGDGIIAIASIPKVYDVLGTKVINVINDENASCDDIYGRYMWVNIKEGNETRITEFGYSGGCYNIEFKDCEILKGVEKFLVETLASRAKS